MTANLTTPKVPAGTSRKLLQLQDDAFETETEFRSQIDDADNTEERLTMVKKADNGDVISFDVTETKIEKDTDTGFVTETKIVTVNGGTEDEVVTETVTVKNQRDELISEIVKVDGEKTICRPPSAGICGGGAAPAPAAAVPRRPAAMLPPPPVGSARNFPSGLAPPGGGRLLAA